MVSRGRRQQLSAALAVVVLLGGCGSGPGSEQDDPGSDSPTSASSTPPETPDEATDEATEPPTEEPSVAPATGPELVISHFEDETFRIRLPEGPRWDVSSSGEVASFVDGAGSWTVSGGAVTSAGPSKGLDFYARNAIRMLRSLDGSAERQADLTIDGVEGYVVEGRNVVDSFVWEYGGVVGDSFLYLKLEVPRDTPKVRAWLESMIASAEWL